MANITKIKLSGTSYNIKDSEAVTTSAMTRAEYDALETKDPSVFYIITDESGGSVVIDPTLSSGSSNAVANSAITNAINAKLNTSDFNTYSGSVDTALSNKQTTLTAGTNITIVDNVISATGGGGGGTIDSSLDGNSPNAVANSAITNAINAKADTSTTYTKTEVDTALSNKQTTLTAGTNITIVDNVISATGGGGSSKELSGGTNISITTGATADTISCTLPITASSNSGIAVNGLKGGISNSFNLESVDLMQNYIFGNGNYLNSQIGGYQHRCIVIEGEGNTGYTQSTHYEGGYNSGYAAYSHLEGYHNTANISVTQAAAAIHIEGKYNTVKNYSEHASGQYNVSVSATTTFGDSGNTLFSVGNGTADNARHNAFEIRQNGDIYITSGGTDIKLQDNLGGGGGTSYTAGDGISISNNVISVSGRVETSAITTSMSSSSTNDQVPSAKAVYDQFGGLKLVKLTQSEYDSLSTKDSMTLYVIVN